jgi:SAM-dependent methyltransferase
MPDLRAMGPGDRSAKTLLVSSDLRATDGFVSPEEYDRGRPSFPGDGLAAVIKALGLKEGNSVLDLGSGTGKLTQGLVQFVPDVIAVDPSQPMLDALRRQLPSVDARIGVAEDIPVDDHSVEAVFVAEAFHWFQVEQSAREIVRVLAPEGHLVLVWQRWRWWDDTEIPWIAEFKDRLEPFWEISVRLAGEHPNVTKQWATELDRLGLFEPFSTFEADFVQRLSVNDFLGFVASWSWVAILPQGERQQALADIHDLVGNEQEIALQYRTEFQCAHVRPSPHM